MMKENKLLKIVLISCFFFSSILTLQALQVPSLKGRVNDQANILTSQQARTLEAMLQETEKQTSAQVALLIIPSLRGENLEEYSLRVAEEWGLGQNDRDNGVLLLIALQDKKMRFEVGYGLEGMITDLKAGYIIRNKIAPEFRKRDFYQGIYAGLETATGIINGKTIISDEELAKYRKDQSKKSSKPFPVGTIIFLLMIFSGIFRGRRGGLFTALLLGSMLGGGNSRGSGLGGGGFGGFSGGGGSFGGGGSSGGW